MNTQIMTTLQWAPLILIAIILLDLLRATLQHGRKNRQETWTNLLVYAGNYAWRSLFSNAMVLAVLTFISQWQVTQIPMTALSALVLLVLGDFAYYWQHRLSHEMRALWAYHNVHHSSNEFNLSTAARLPWFGKFTDALFFAPLVIIGFNPVAVIAIKQINLLYQFWIHSDRIGKLGWFDRWFNSPSNHRVHHAANAKYLDRNHGGMFMVWDRMFGTYQAEEEKPVFGLTKPMTTKNPLIINLHEFVRIGHDLKQNGFNRNAWKIVFGYPS